MIYLVDRAIQLLNNRGLVFKVCFLVCLQHDLQGHISDVNTCRFFPSGKVVLSGGADLRLKIWSAEDGSCPVTLKGHSGGDDGLTLYSMEVLLIYLM